MIMSLYVASTEESLLGNIIEVIKPGNKKTFMPFFECLNLNLCVTLESYFGKILQFVLAQHSVFSQCSGFELLA